MRHPEFMRRFIALLRKEVRQMLRDKSNLAVGLLLPIALILLFGYGLLQLLFMLRLMPWYLSQPFNASFWSFSFGVSALATTGLHLGQSSPSGFFHVIALPLFIFTNVIIVMLLVRTFILLMQGKLLVRTDKALLMPSEEK